MDKIDKSNQIDASIITESNIKNPKNDFANMMGVHEIDKSNQIDTSKINESYYIKNLKNDCANNFTTDIDETEVSKITESYIKNLKNDCANFTIGTNETDASIITESNIKHLKNDSANNITDTDETDDQ